MLVADTSYTIPALAPGTYYAVITAEDTAIGIMSPPVILGPFVIGGAVDEFSSGFSSAFF